jgi:hypothetical protein
MHLKLTDAELTRLGNRVEEDIRGARDDHNARIERFRRYHQMWRNRVEAPAANETGNPNFSVPLLQWQVYSKLATEMNALFGDDAEIVAVPTGPSDQRTVHKIGRYMTWRVFASMKIVNTLTAFDFRKLLYGRTHAYTPWVKETYLTPDGEEVWYEGPGFFPLRPDDLIVPAETKDSIQDFSFVVRQYRISPQELLDGERAGRYFGIRENFQQILDYARRAPEREAEGQEIRAEEDLAEGVNYEGGLARRDSLLCYEWHGRWRLPKGTTDSGEDDLRQREEHETELVVRYLPDLHKVVGVLRLIDLYPRMRNRRPFVEASLVKDGSYWSPGFGELLESIQDEATANHRLFTKAGWFSVGPLVFYRPGSGFDPETFKYEPLSAVASENPGDVNVVRMSADLQYPLAKEQGLKGYAEMVTGISDQTMGRAIDRPNAPRTASGQLALIQQGNIRASLDTLSLREDFGAIASHLWMLDTQFAPESQFFRVTEEDAQGLFETARGGSTITGPERGGRYDFTIKFATSYWSREAEKERALTRYQLDLANPLIVTNPKALWKVTNDVHKALGDDNFARVVPEPPDLDLPRRPAEEWNLCLQGEDFTPNPMDNDDLHLMDHQRRVREAQGDPQGDMDAVARMIVHIDEQVKQKQQKMLMAALTQSLAKQISQQAGAMPGATVAASPIPAGAGSPGGGAEATGPGLPNPLEVPGALATP